MLKVGLVACLEMGLVLGLSSVGFADVSDDSQIVQAIQNHKDMNFAEGANMVVTKLLPDDTSGLEHQKWVVRLSNGKQLTAIYNLDMCERVPLQVGDSVSMGGQLIMTGRGAILHWLHHDPKHHRPDGYVELDGKTYCNPL